MIILTLVFGVLFRVAVVNYAAYALIGLLVWRFFSIGTGQGLYALVNNASLVRNIYVPRYILVFANSLSNLIGACIEFIAFLPLLVLLQVNVTLTILVLPILLSMEFLLVFSLSLALSSLNLKYRDFYQLWDIALQLGFFLSPIIYDESIIPSRFQMVYSFNPVTRLIDSTRAIFLQARLPTSYDVIIMALNILFFAGLGFLIFRHLERRFAEEL